MLRLGSRRLLTARRAGLGAAALGFALVPVVIVGGPASALAPSPVGYRNYELTVLPDVNEGASPTEAAALLDTERNSAGLAEGAAHDAVVPEAMPEATGWKGVSGAAGSLISAVAAMPLIFKIGDAVTGNYFAKAAKEDCAVKDQGFFGALSAWAAGVAGYSCAQSGSLPQDPGYLPVYKGQAGPAGFPQTIAAPTYANTYSGSVTWGTPYWSTVTFTLRDGKGYSAQEGWVYPVNWTGNYYSAIGAPYLPVTLLARDASGNIVSSQSNVSAFGAANTALTKGPCSAQMCFSVSRLLDVMGTDGDAAIEAGGDGAISSISADTGSSRVNTVPVTPPPGYSIAAGSGAPNTSAGAAQVELQTTVTDDQGNTATCTTQPFTDGGGVIPQPCEPTLPSGWGVTTHRQVEMIPVTGTQPPTVIQDYETSPGYQQQEKQFPQCSTTLCLLTLTKIAGSPQGECSDFSTDPNPCADWASDPNEASDYRCDYGGTQVALAECEKAYKRMYKPGAITSGQVYVDPGGDPVVSQPPKPVDPGPVTTTPPTTTTSPSDCFPNGWGVFNPAEWVLKPVECALVWAFVPPADTLTSLQARFQGDIANTPLGQVDGLVNGLTAPFLGIGASGCQGPPLRFNAFGVDQTYYPMDACSEPVAGAASFVSGALGFTVVALSVLSITRYIAGTVGFVGFATTRMKDSTAGEGGKS